jgi:hypothetical protein
MVGSTRCCGGPFRHPPATGRTPSPSPGGSSSRRPTQLRSCSPYGFSLPFFLARPSGGQHPWLQLPQLRFFGRQPADDGARRHRRGRRRRAHRDDEGGHQGQWRHQRQAADTDAGRAEAGPRRAEQRRQGRQDAAKPAPGVDRRDAAAVPRSARRRPRRFTTKARRRAQPATTRPRATSMGQAKVVSTRSTRRSPCQLLWQEEAQMGDWAQPAEYIDLEKLVTARP